MITTFLICLLSWESYTFAKDPDLSYGDDTNHQAKSNVIAKSSVLGRHVGHIPWVSWSQLVHSVTAARCTLLSNGSLLDRSAAFKDISEHDPYLLSTARSISSDTVCHLPIFLFFHNEKCPVCRLLIDEISTNPEFELLSEYMTMVSVETLDDLIHTYPYPRPRLYGMSPLSRGSGRRLGLSVREKELLQKTLAPQGEYVPRVFFLFPHNGSVMPVFNKGPDSDSSHLHFYSKVESLLGSMVSAIRIMDKKVNVYNL
uniref:Thioredoxin domain-containing protein n=1 Tax=Trypanosoma congolense (strain IL3000) TaxID=1068625 RepID=G0UQ38_TRYCI|nr:conserved hypothetical protein [Trypanosoma congolense IL3000]